jgi:hypothetical protein
VRVLRARRIDPLARAEWRKWVDPGASISAVVWQVQGFLFSSRPVAWELNVHGRRDGARGERVLGSWRHPGLYLIVNAERVVTQVRMAPWRTSDASRERSNPAGLAAPARVTNGGACSATRLVDVRRSNRPPVRVSRVASRPEAVWQRRLDRRVPRHGTWHCQQRRGKR